MQFLIRYAVGTQPGNKIVRVLQILAVIRAHQAILSDNSRVAGLPQAVPFPSTLTGHDIADGICRELEREHADPLLPIVDRACDKLSRLSLRSLIGFKVGEEDSVRIISSQASLQDFCQIAIPIGTIQEVSAKVPVLGHVVKSPSSFIVDEIKIVIAETFNEMPESAVILFVDATIVAAVSGVCQLITVLRRMRVFHDIEILKLNPAGEVGK